MANRMRVVIYLFRNDLRFLDNEALKWSSQNSDLMIPLYCLDPRHFTGTSHFGFPRTGPFRFKFLKECLTDLRETLAGKGSGLVVKKGEPEKVIPDLVEHLGKDKHNFTLVWQEEVTRDEVAVEKCLGDYGVPTRSFWGSTLYHKADIPFKTEQIPDVYTEFRKGVEARSKVKPLISMPESLPPLPDNVDQGVIPEAQELGVEEAAVDKNTAFPFNGGETSALERLKDYLWNTDHVSTYKETRNEMIGPDYSTKFAPWLSLGCLSPRYIYSEIKRYESTRTANQSTYWVIFELIWRDYFKFVAAKYGDRLFELSGLLGKDVEWKQNEKLFDAWKEGKTGVPYIDANMREMAATGFMSNRGRQNVASFLTKDLCLDWRLGAEWFEANLTDYDVCSNYGNWLYSAGLGNDPRENRKFNVIKQGLDYDPEGDYVRRWVPELVGIGGGEVHYPWVLQASALSRGAVRLGETYPQPIITAPEWNKFYNKA